MFPSVRRGFEKEMSQAHAWGGGREEGKGRAPPLEVQARHIAGRPRACIRAQLLDHALIRQRRCPSPSSAHHFYF